jgi:hypothetical protein
MAGLLQGSSPEPETMVQRRLLLQSGSCAHIGSEQLILIVCVV